MTEKDKMRRIVSFGVAPTGVCSACGKEHFLDELHPLPEVELYTREMARSLIRGENLPDPPSDEFLFAHYGYGVTALFCHDCYDELQVS